jgi:hypothetical protein
MLESFVRFCDVLDASILKSSTPRESMNEGFCERVGEGMFDLPGQRGRQCKIFREFWDGKGTAAPPHASQLTGDSRCAAGYYPISSRLRRGGQWLHPGANAELPYFLKRHHSFVEAMQI